MATITVFPNYSPRIIRVDSPATEITLQELFNLIREWEHDPENMSYEYLISGSGKEDLGGGVTVGITAQLNNAKVMFEERPDSLDSGTATASDSQGEVLTDDTAQFVTDGLIYAGCTVVNEASDAMAVIVDIISDTQLRHLPLSGGGSWTASEAYTIYPNVQCSITGGNLVAVDDVGDVMSPVLPSPNTQIKMALSSSATIAELDITELDPLVGSIADQVWDEARADHVATGSFGELMSNLRDEAFGKWAVDPIGKTLTLYKADGSTILQVFDLTSTTGTVPDFIERVPQ
jgi:hypothetical protein